MNITINEEEFDTTTGKIPDILKEQFAIRTGQCTTCKNRMTIGKVTKALWWNRPRHSDTVSKESTDGLGRIDLPYIKDIDSYKTDYNLLIGTGCLPIAINLDVTSLDESTKNYLQELVMNTIIKTLEYLGVDMSHISLANNDLLYDGKKFVGDESTFKDNIFIETTVITLNYSNEKEIFDKLTGEHALKRGITGIIEETNSFSREQFIELFTRLYKNAIIQL